MSAYRQAPLFAKAAPRASLWRRYLAWWRGTMRTLELRRDGWCRSCRRRLVSRDRDPGAVPQLWFCGCRGRAARSRAAFHAAAESTLRIALSRHADRPPPMLEPTTGRRETR